MIHNRATNIYCLLLIFLMPKKEAPEIKNLKHVFSLILSDTLTVVSDPKGRRQEFSNMSFGQLIAELGKPHKGYKSEPKKKKTGKKGKPVANPKTPAK